MMNRNRQTSTRVRKPTGDASPLRGFLRGSSRARTAFLLAGLGVWIALTGTAFAADEAGSGLQKVTWFHPNPDEVHSFVLFVSSEQGARDTARRVPVGKPAGKTLSTRQFFEAIVDMKIDDYVAVAAIGRNGLESSLSAWGRPQPTQPGQPLPQP